MTSCRMRSLHPKAVSRFLGIAFLAVSLNACSSAKKKTEPELALLEGKRVALLEVAGESTARKIVEVSLVNQLLKRGTFILVPKQEVEQARLDPAQDPMDHLGIARRAGAEFALTAEVLKLSAEEHSGYSKENVHDSQLAEEQGNDGETERIVKVKSLDGEVEVRLRFTSLKDPSETRSAIAQAKDHVEANEKESAIHLPPKLRFLESLCNRAFQSFFERYQ